VLVHAVGERPRLIRAVAARVLAACERLDTAEGHTDRILRLAGPGAPPSATVMAILRRLEDEGLLLSERAFLAALRSHAAAPNEAARVAMAGVITRDRPAALDRCARSYSTTPARTAAPSSWWSWIRRARWRLAPLASVCSRSWPGRDRPGSIIWPPSALRPWPGS
jgi:hypothetical protein